MTCYLTAEEMKEADREVEWLLTNRARKTKGRHYPYACVDNELWARRAIWITYLVINEGYLIPISEKILSEMSDLGLKWYLNLMRAVPDPNKMYEKYVVECMEELLIICFDVRHGHVGGYRLTNGEKILDIYRDLVNIRNKSLTSLLLEYC